jgi:putative ABC transport system permease protein
LDGVPYTIVAIMPPEFETTFGIRGDDFWSPYVSEKFRQFERENGYELIGRVSSVKTIDQARQEIQSIAASIDVDGWGGRGRTLDAVPLLQVVVGDSAYVLQLLLGAVAVVLASVALLVLTGLIGRTLLTLLPSNPGFEASSRTALQLSLPPFPQPTDRIRVLDELQRRVRQLPGIVEVGLGSNFPFGHDDGFRPVRDPNGTAFSADVRAISTNYFQLLQMPLIRGRVFTANDDGSSPRVAVVNQTFARKLAPLGDVLGRRVEVGGSKAVHEIVGIVADARSSGTTTEVWDEIYVPYAQSSTTVAYLIVRSQLDSGTLDVMLRKEIRAVAPEAPDHPLLRATAIEDMVSRALAGPRFSAILFSAFSANALLLAAIGVFGLVSYSVSQRRFEYGIRAALGAHSSNLIGMTMRSAGILIATGVLVGIIAAVYLTRFVETQVYAIEPLDMPTFTSAAAVMTAVALAACYVPARRAARVDPLVALRYE